MPKWSRNTARSASGSSSCSERSPSVVSTRVRLYTVTRPDSVRRVQTVFCVKWESGEDWLYAQPDAKSAKGSRLAGEAVLRLTVHEQVEPTVVTRLDAEGARRVLLIHAGHEAEGLVERGAEADVGQPGLVQVDRQAEVVEPDRHLAALAVHAPLQEGHVEPHVLEQGGEGTVELEQNPPRWWPTILARRASRSRTIGVPRWMSRFSNGTVRRWARCRALRPSASTDGGPSRPRRARCSALRPSPAWRGTGRGPGRGPGGWPIRRSSTKCSVSTEWGLARPSGLASASSNSTQVKASPNSSWRNW